MTVAVVTPPSSEKKKHGGEVKEEEEQPVITQESLDGALAAHAPHNNQQEVREEGAWIQYNIVAICVGDLMIMMIIGNDELAHITRHTSECATNNSSWQL